MLDILFVNSTETNQLRHEVNGTMLLATKLLQSGFAVDILRFHQIEDTKNYSLFISSIVDKIIKLNPKCVSFYTLWPYYHIMLRIASEIKNKDSNIITVFGGPQSSATAYATMKNMNYIDYISTGEGENIIVPLMTALINNDSEKLEGIPGLYFRKDNEVTFNHICVPISDLNNISHWDDRLYLDYSADTQINKSDYYMPIEVGRGCPYNCTFCSTSVFWNRNYRLKSAEAIIEEIKYYKDKFNITSFSFSHDMFTANKKSVTEICDAILENELDITWKCTSRINCLTEELVLKMKESGMRFIEMGIETGSARMQKLTNKKLDLTYVKEMVEFLRKNDIKVALFFMYGFPEETVEDLNQSLSLLFSFIDMGITKASMAFCRFNASTKITNTYMEQLEFNPDIKILFRDVFGIEEELNIIKENKEIFPHFYHLSTEVRDEYQYVIMLIAIYRNSTNSAKYVRALYKGDNLKFYKDFYNNNIKLFESNIQDIKFQLLNNAPLILKNTIKKFKNSKEIKIVNSLLDYDFNVQKVHKSKKDIEIKQIYDFSYIEYQMKLPIEQFSNSRTKILLSKKQGKFDVKILSIVSE